MTKNRATLAFISAIFALSLAVIGCGSDDESTTESRISKAAFVKSGDQICRENYSKRGRVLVSLNEKYVKGKKELPSQALQEELLVERVMPIFREQSEELNELPLPKTGTKEAKQILSGLEEAIEGVEANPARSIKQGTGVEFAEVEALAQDYGFQYCGRS